MQDLSHGRAAQLSEIKRELSRSQATFFVEKEQVCGRMREIAAAAQQHKGLPCQVVQHQLRDQFEAVQEVVELTPEELLAELQALQLAAPYGDGIDDDVSGAERDVEPVSGGSGDRHRGGRRDEEGQEDSGC